MRLKRRLTGFYALAKSGAAVSVVLAAGLAAGCSSDFSRFTEGISKSSAPQHTAQVSPYPPAPVKGAAYSGKVESSNLAPPPGAEPAAPAAAAQSGSLAPARNAAPQPAQSSRPQTAAAEMPKKRKISYKVAAGDTLLGLAGRFGTKISDIKRDNRLSGDKILIGQKLTIFTARKNAESSAAEAKTDKAKTAANSVPVPTPDPDNASAANSAAGSGNNLAAAPAGQNAAPAANSAQPAGAAPQAGNSGNAAGESAPAKTGNNAAAGGAKGEQNLAASVAPAAGAAASAPGANNNSAAKPAAAAGQPAPAGQNAAPAAEDSAPMIWPVRGNIISSYGQRAGTATNDGIDIAVPEGTPVKAADAGTVIYAGDGLKEFGNTILIRHDNNIVTVYGHNSKLLVSRGQTVQKGDIIAQSGSSGNAAVAKLHFEVRKNSAPVDPMKYLPLSSAH